MRSIWIWVVMALGAVPEDRRDQEVMNLMKTLRKRHPTWKEEKIDKVAKEHVYLANQNSRSRSASPDGIEAGSAVSDRSKSAERSSQGEYHGGVFPAIRSVLKTHPNLANKELIPIIYATFPHVRKLDMKRLISAISQMRAERRGPKGVASIAGTVRQIFDQDERNILLGDDALIEEIRRFIPDIDGKDRHSVLHQVYKVRVERLGPKSAGGGWELVGKTTTPKLKFFEYTSVQNDGWSVRLSKKIKDV